MKRKILSLHSILPPAELKARLDREVQARNDQERGRCRFFLRWKSENRFTLCMAEYEEFVGVGREGPSMRTGSRMRRNASYSVILCGEIAPEGNGSVIVGQFRQLLSRWFLLIIAAGCFIGLAVAGQWLACLLIAVLGVPFLYYLLNPMRSRSGGALWAELESLVATVDSHGAG